MGAGFNDGQRPNLQTKHLGHLGLPTGGGGCAVFLHREHQIERANEGVCGPGDPDGPGEEISRVQAVVAWAGSGVDPVVSKAVREGAWATGKGTGGVIGVHVGASCLGSHDEGRGGGGEGGGVIDGGEGISQ